MDKYGQFCPVSLAAEIVARRWTPLIVRELLSGSTRFNELRRGIPNITASVLSRRLNELEIAGIIEQCRDEKGMQYLLTPAGAELRPVVEQLGVWGRRWLPTDYDEDDLDPRLLVWDIHRNLQLDRVPGRTLIELHFRDALPERRGYWLIVAPEGAEVCLTHPGGDIDLHLSTDVRTLTNIWMGNMTWAAALRGGTLKLAGRSELQRAFPSWLKLNIFAPIKPVPRSDSSPGVGAPQATPA